MANTGIASSWPLSENRSKSDRRRWLRSLAVVMSVASFLEERIPARWGRRLHACDLFPKSPGTETKDSSWQGTFATVLAFTLVSVLIVSEFRLYNRTFELTDLEVDNTAEEYIPFTFNLTFPRCACSVLSIDAVDISGNARHSIESDIMKTPLNREGQQTSVPQHDEAGSDAEVPEELKRTWETPQNYCGSCHVPVSMDSKFVRPPPECCNTCADVKALYHANGWSIVQADRQFEQCYREALTALRDVEGCKLDGFIQVPKVKGAVMIAPGAVLREAYRFSRLGAPRQSRNRFDLSHIIRRVEFGESYPGMIVPLSHLERTCPYDEEHVFRYFIKVVPTKYESVDGRSLVTNQYGVTEFSKQVSTDDVSPGAYEFPRILFQYSMSGLKIHVSEHRKSFKHFLTHLCAILGGVFVVTGMVHHSVRVGIKSIFGFGKNVDKFKMSLKKSQRLLFPPE